MMGNFLFEVRSSKWLGMLYAVISFIIALGAACYLFTAWSALGIIGKVIVALILFGAVFYGYDRINVIGHSKILFYEKGFEVHTKGEVDTLYLADISSSSFNNSNGSLTMKFTRTDGTIVSLDADDFSRLADLLEDYGRQVNFDIRTRF